MMEISILNSLVCIIGQGGREKFCIGETILLALQTWSSWTANSDKNLNVNKPYATSQKTAFQKFCKIFCQFSRYYTFW